VIWRDGQLSLDSLRGKTVCVIGFGSQGRAQSLNLRDSGISVLLGLREGSAREAEARALGLRVEPIDQAVEGSDVIALLTPERSHASVVDEWITPRARPGAAVVFAHGFSVRYGQVGIRDDLHRLLVAPKAIGPRLRTLYESGQGAYAMIAAEPGDLEIAKAYAKALGCGRAGVILSSFREETETDLFGEQAVLCGGMIALAHAAYQTLVEAGYSREAAYIECVEEIKLIADLVFERGIAGMTNSISDTAQFGAMTAQNLIANPETISGMNRMLHEIRSGAFAKRFAEEQAAGFGKVEAFCADLRQSDMEEARKTLLNE
jgi:ketol-acid reductoisomerase